LAATICVTGRTSVLSLSLSATAIAQLLVPRSIPRLKRGFIESGILMICAQPLSRRSRVLRLPVADR
jgi:hypothetical protein